MKYIEGVELLYAEFHSSVAIEILFWIFVVLAAIVFIAIISIIIEDQEWKNLWIPFVWVFVCSIFILLGASVKNPYTDYYVQIDDSVSFNEVVDVYGIDSIHVKDNNVYRIVVTDYGD